VLGGAEGLLNRPQLLVTEPGFERIEIGIGAQHEDAVEPFLAARGRVSHGGTRGVDRSRGQQQRLGRAQDR
jgi:hypothetical protein